MEGRIILHHNNKQMENLLETSEIATVKIEYTKEGRIQLAKVEGNIRPVVGQSTLNSLKQIGNKTPEEIKNQADLLLGKLFSSITDIELSDPANTGIVSEVVECDKYPGGNVKKCVIKYFFKQN